MKVKNMEVTAQAAGADSEEQMSGWEHKPEFFDQAGPNVNKSSTYRIKNKIAIMQQKSQKQEDFTKKVYLMHIFLKQYKNAIMNHAV